MRASASPRVLRVVVVLALSCSTAAFLASEQFTCRTESWPGRPASCRETARFDDSLSLSQFLALRRSLAREETTSDELTRRTGTPTSTLPRRPVALSAPLAQIKVGTASKAARRRRVGRSLVAQTDVLETPVDHNAQASLPQRIWESKKGEEGGSRRRGSGSGGGEGGWVSRALTRLALRLLVALDCTRRRRSARAR